MSSSSLLLQSDFKVSKWELLIVHSSIRSMLNRSVYVQRCLTNSIRKREIRVKPLCHLYWSDANNIRAQSIRRLPKDNVTVTNTNTNTTKLSRKSDSSFPDIRLRNLSASRPNSNQPKVQAFLGHAFEGLQKREFTAQRIKKITGTVFIFPVIELLRLVLSSATSLCWLFDDKLFGS